MLIVDMSMPKNCGECPLLYMEIVKCTVTGRDCTEYGAERPSWCPIKGELVRCKDCRHRDPDDKRCDHGWMYFSFHRPDGGYCEHGER